MCVCVCVHTSAYMVHAALNNFPQGKRKTQILWQHKTPQGWGVFCATTLLWVMEVSSLGSFVRGHRAFDLVNGEGGGRNTLWGELERGCMVAVVLSPGYGRYTCKYCRSIETHWPYIVSDTARSL